MAHGQAESEEHGSQVVGTHGQVKQRTNKIARYLALLGSGKDWLALGQNNATEWDIRS